VGLDLSRASEGALDGARLLRQAGPCDVTFVHLYQPPVEYARFGLTGPRAQLVGDVELRSLLERDLRARVGELTGEGKVALRLRPSWGHPGDSLNMHAGEPVDVVVVGTHQRRGWSRLVHGSVAHAVLHGARTPVLCVPVPAQAEVGPIPHLAHVIVSTDFSALASAAVPYAYALLRATGGLVELCHVTDEQELTSQRRAELEHALEALIPADAALTGVTTRVQVIPGGNPAQAIVAAAERLGVDAICLASHGRTGLDRVLLGSVAEEVIRRASKPVLVVRRPPA
jgi:nucleotide-binding universal stress UspA family protein